MGEESKVTNTDLGLMLALALLFDGSQIALEWLLGWLAGAGFLASPLVSIFAIPSYFIWFSVKGLMNFRLGMGMFGVGLGEVIPVIDELPLWTGLITSIIIDEKKKKLGPLAAVIPTGGKAPGAAAGAAPSATKAPTETTPKTTAEKRKVWVNDKLVEDTEAF